MNYITILNNAVWLVTPTPARLKYRKVYKPENRLILLYLFKKIKVTIPAGPYEYAILRAALRGKKKW